MDKPILAASLEHLLTELERRVSLHWETVLWYVPLGLIFSLLVLLGINLLLLGLLCTRKRFHQGQVGETTGTISTTRLVQQPDEGDNPIYEAQVNYDYRVGGWPYEGSITLRVSSQAAKAQAALETYSSGQRVAITYDLRSPHISRLQSTRQAVRSRPWGSGYMGAGLLLIIIGYGLGRGMTIGFWPDSWQDPWGLTRSTGTVWGMVVALLLASGFHGWGAAVPPNLATQNAVILFQHNPVMFAVWRSPAYRWLNGGLAGLYGVLASALIR